MLITPEYVFKDVTHITTGMAGFQGHHALVLDIDNTLTADRSQGAAGRCGRVACRNAQGRGKADHRLNGAEKQVRPFGKAGSCLPVPC